MKRTFSVLLILMAVLPVFAARLLNQPVTITQPDGSEYSVLASGDEFHNWLHDDRNYTIILNEATGWYTWAVRNGSELAASGYIVGQTDPAALGLATGVNISSEQLRQKYRLAELMNPVSANQRVPHFGTINNLVVFIKFANSPDFSQTIPFYDNLFNNTAPGYNSMRNYFQAVSYNQLDIVSHYYPVPDSGLVVCYVDSQPRQYYMPQTTSNPIGYDEDNYDERALREFTLLTNAINYISTQVPSTLDLDGDDDGDVDNVCFIIQGGTTAWATLLWPHRWSIYNSTAYVNGARVYDFNFQLESFLNSSGTSVLCHEMFHTLGAPDLYRYYDDTIDPVGEWDLMCANNNPPQSMSIWMKYKYADWVSSVPLLTESGTYSIRSVWSPTNNIYRIPSWRNTEYFILEYRKPYGIYDSNLPGEGLLIYRLNMNEDGNADGPPDELYIYRPGGSSNTVNGIIDLAYFSQQSGRTFMNENTVPNGFLSDEMPGGLDISQISAAGGDSMTFHVNISNVQVTYPQGGETFFGGDSKEIRWKARTQIGYAKLEYSVNGGQSWQVIINSTANDGSYTWVGLPVIDSDQCLVRVTTIANGAVDACNAPFSIISSIGVPNPLFPLNNMVNAPTNPTFRWNSVSGAESYTIQVALDSLFVSTLLNIIDLTDTTYTYNNLMPFTTYWWQVAAFASVGLSEFSQGQKFTTGNISILPAITTLISPPNSSTNQPRNALLRWNPATYAYYYHYQVATDSYFSNIVEENDSLQATEIRLQPLNPNTRYFWRVRAGNPAGYSNFSNIRNFVTGDFMTPNEDEVSVPLDVLLPNQPNPFSSSTEIGFRLKDTSQPVRLAIYNLKGQQVKVLFSGKAKSGINLLLWDGTDHTGRAVAPGVYYYRLQSKGLTQTRKLLLIK